MGNDISRGANRLAIAAMSNVTHLDKRELLGLQKKFAEVARKQGNPNMISREEFQECLEFVGIHESDGEILDRLFTMCDRTGDNSVSHREFLIGLSPLISGDAAEKVGFAFRLFDAENTGELRPSDMIFILASMNNVSSYFGDPVMSHEHIEQLVDDVIKENATTDQHVTTIHYAEYLTSITAHALFLQFLSGGGTVRYGSAGL